jgi:glycosyltransferase involved in cell wall biosynthesis
MTGHLDTLRTSALRSACRCAAWMRRAPSGTPPLPDWNHAGSCSAAAHGDPMRVLYWGTYDAEYVRNRFIIEGLRLNGVDVVECHVSLWNGTDDKVRNVEKGWLNPRLWVRLVWAYIRLAARYTRMGDYDVLMVGYAGHLDVFPGRVLSWLSRRPLVFDAFLSLHETIVEDRALLRKSSLASRMLFWMERAGCAIADLVLLDTDANIEYFCQKYRLPRGHFSRVWVGADPSFRPMPPRAADGLFRALYFGKFIPLHGIEHVIRAAGLLRERPEIQFEFIGDGQTYDTMRALASSLALTNITWGPRWLQPEDLASRVAEADVCLGIFGTSPKALRVIPTKAYVALAMGKPLITEDSPAAKELLTDKVNALLCEPGNAQALANEIARLSGEPDVRLALSAGGRELYTTKLGDAAIGQTLLQSLAVWRRAGM